MTDKKYNVNREKFKMKFLKKIKTTTYWIDLDEPKLTFQKHDLDHETIIILNKAN
jgi:hypothetical protein